MPLPTAMYHATVKIYTRTGDRGTTSLLSGGKVDKDDLRVEAYGTVDELNASLGVLRAEPLPADCDRRLEQIQNDLFSIGSELADPERRHVATLPPWDADALEGWIDAMESELEPLRSFVLPGGSRAAALAHVARTVCRRAERRVRSVERSDQDAGSRVLVYLNRLSDALFVLARLLNARSGRRQPIWRPAETSPDDGGSRDSG